VRAQPETYIEITGNIEVHQPVKNRFEVSEERGEAAEE
jgi:hypothetical protein